MDNATAGQERLLTQSDAPAGGGPHVDDLIDDLRRRLLAAISAQRALLRPGTVSIVLGMPEIAPWRPRAPSGPQVYWARSRDGHFRVGVGRVAAFEARGSDRFERLAAAFSQLRTTWTNLDPEGTGLWAAAFAGFSFCAGQRTSARRPDAQLFLPAVALVRHGQQVGMVFSAQLAAASDPRERLPGWLEHARALLSATLTPERTATPVQVSRDCDGDSVGRWVGRVEAALQAIDSGALDKLVLSRRVRLTAARPLEVSGILEWLGTHYPGCALFAVRDEHSTLVGASPERLVALDGGRVVADALAGTSARDSDADCDSALGEGLLRDPKALREHVLVVRQMQRALEPLCYAVTLPERPRLLRLPTLQHLWSPLRARVRASTTVLDLARALHPTPAVSGSPHDAALRWLAANGEQDRGWYTGALGWVAPDGGGELSVVLRCGELRGNTAELCAGAGIVAGSDPAQELAETEWKLRALSESLKAG